MQDTVIIPIVHTLIIDDHQLLRQGLKAVLHSFKKQIDFRVHEFDCGEKALHHLSNTEAELVIIDHTMEGINGAVTIERMRRFRPQVKFLALSNYNDYMVIDSMMQAGALGYVLKSVGAQELLTAIRSVLAGKKYFCSEVALVMIAAAEDRTTSEQLGRYKISERELEVLLLIVQGFTNVQIAEKLFLNRRTIDTHRQNLLQKMKVNNTAALVRLALQMGLVK
ncbi:response regulator [Ferruginibacter sp.]